MARLQKYTLSSVGSLMKHNNRAPNDKVEHSNEEIDGEKTYMNYYIKKGSIDALKNRLDEVFSEGRKTQNVCVEVCVTLPDNVNDKDEKAFFRSVYDYYAKTFGERNIINAVVHKDETKPHLHLDFTPVVTGEYEYTVRNRLQLIQWKETHKERLAELKEEYKKPVIERLCCSEVITREYLLQMHEKLSDYVSKELGYDCGILNGATVGGNKSVLELKLASLKKEIAALEAQKETSLKERDTILSVVEKSGVTRNDISFFPLMQKIADLERQNAIYRDIIARNGYKYKNEDLAVLSKQDYIPANTSNVNVFDGNLKDTEIDKNGIVFIELYNKVERPLPQQDFIDNDADLQQQINLAMKSPNGAPFFVRSSRTSDKVYMFVRTDNSKDTAIALYDMQERLIEQQEDWRNRKLYMERISNDEFDLARQLMLKTDLQTVYLTGKSDKTTADKEHALEEEQQK